MASTSQRKPSYGSEIQSYVSNSLLGMWLFAITSLIYASRYSQIKRGIHVVTMKCGQESGGGRLR